MTVLEPIVVAPEARAAVKAYLRLETANEDGLIDGLVAAATAHAEAFLAQVATARAATQVIDAGPEWRRLTHCPVRAIAEVAAADGSALPVDAHAIDIDAAGDGWVRCAGPARLRVRYMAGLAADWAGLPEAVRQGVIRLAAHLYTHRDAADEGEPPVAIVALWRPWRRMRLR
jgi:uncharacterized phiE125 gp8 family phage protein